MLQIAAVFHFLLKNSLNWFSEKEDKKIAGSSNPAIFLYIVSLKC